MFLMYLSCDNYNVCDNNYYSYQKKINASSEMDTY